MANPRWFPSAPPYTPHPYQCCSRCPPGLPPPTATAAAAAAPPARARLAAPGRPRNPRGPAAPWGQPAPRRSDVARQGGARGLFRKRPRSCSGARGAGKRRPAPPEPGAAPASRTPAAPRAGGARTRHGRGDAAAPRAAPRDREPPASRNRRLRRVGARPGPSPQSSARNTHPERGRQKAEGRRGWGGRSHLSCRAHGARPRLTCPGPDAPSNALELSR